MMKHQCEKCKQSLSEKDFYSASLKYGYKVCKICTDEKRKAHKEGREPKYNKHTRLITPKKTKSAYKRLKSNNHWSNPQSYELSYDFKSVDYGQIYVIGVDLEDPFEEPVKIGFTKSSVKNRLSQLNSSHWKDLKLIYESIEIPWPTILEKYLHKKYKKHKVGREWFKLDEWHLDDIEEYCEMTYIKLDILREYDILIKENSNNTERIQLLEKLYKNVLNPDCKKMDDYCDGLEEEWSQYWNEKDLKYFSERFYN